ncbi:hypothetical protein [Pedobacter foliorum]|uniref:hypothetical protein n=1 Tax=Pedobacter foliorum TaxID=2739058 RepID=UPI0015657750|nr:hypothetical protein [Pedobacter foliorum]NRF39581.1 hypothetical protein [Pedobacter foliorum]
MKTAFTCLYYLENDSNCLLEIKRNDLPANADISDVFRWLHLNKETSEFSPLTFRSMDSSDEVQERFFDEGYLKFNAQTGTYIEKFNSAQHQLENKKGTAISAELKKAISQYLGC